MFEDQNKKNQDYKHYENNSNKYNPAISFIEEDHAKQRKENFNSSNSAFKPENVTNVIGNNDKVKMENNYNENK